MKTLLNTFKQMRIGRRFIEFLIWMVVAYVMVYLLTFVFPPTGPYSQFPAGVLRGMLGLGLLIYMDRVHHFNIDTRKAIEQKNIAYALIMIAYALIIMAMLFTI